MGNEFGHPEWIDFPRSGNNDSYHYARRQWSLADNPDLRYKGLLDFDRDMITLMKEGNILETPTVLIKHDGDRNLLIYRKNDYIFIFNFHPSHGRDISVEIGDGEYEVRMDINWMKYEGWAKVDETKYSMENGMINLHLYNRSALVLKLI
jgi:1,4-alpha-glucan branching enzyme